MCLVMTGGGGSDVPTVSPVDAYKNTLCPFTSYFVRKLIRIKQTVKSISLKS